MRSQSPFSKISCSSTDGSTNTEPLRTVTVKLLMSVPPIFMFATRFAMPRGPRRWSRSACTCLILRRLRASRFLASSCAVRASRMSVRSSALASSDAFAERALRYAACAASNSLSAPFVFLTRPTRRYFSARACAGP